MESQKPAEPSPTTATTDLEQGDHLHNEGKKQVRTGDKSNEQVVIPKNRIIIVFIGLMLTVFLAALDQTIVCTSPILRGP